jgi:hypothetical protein
VGAGATGPPPGAGSLAFGAQAANRAVPVTIPAALRKSRRERYSDLGVISEESTGMDLILSVIVSSSFSLSPVVE